MKSVMVFHEPCNRKIPEYPGLSGSDFATIPHEAAARAANFAGMTIGGRITGRTNSGQGVITQWERMGIANRGPLMRVIQSFTRDLRHQVFSRITEGNMDQEMTLEATTGFEPVIKVLQTSALPLGYVAVGSHYKQGRLPKQDWVAPRRLARQPENRHNTRYD